MYHFQQHFDIRKWDFKKILCVNAYWTELLQHWPKFQASGKLMAEQNFCYANPHSKDWHSPRFFLPAGTSHSFEKYADKSPDKQEENSKKKIMYRGLYSFLLNQPLGP